MYNPATGRFNRLDDFVGAPNDPQSYHKYAYVHGDPVNAIDPTGESALGVGVSVSIGIGLFGIAVNRFLAVAEGAKHEFYKNRGTGSGGKDVTGAMRKLMERMSSDWSLLHIDKKADIAASLGRTLDWRQTNFVPTMDFNPLGLNKNAASGWDVIQLASPLEQQVNSKTENWFPRSVTVAGDVYYAHDVNYFFFGYLHGLAYHDDHYGTTASSIDLNSLDMLEAGGLVSLYRPAAFLMHAGTAHDGSEANRKNWVYAGWRSAITDSFITPDEDRYGLPNAAPNGQEYRGSFDFKAFGLHKTFVVNSRY